MKPASQLLSSVPGLQDLDLIMVLLVMTALIECLLFVLHNSLAIILYVFDI